MSATATATAAPRRRSPLRAMTRTELRLMLREPIIFFWCIAFPALVLIILGAIRSDRRPSAHYGGASLVSVYVPILVSFAIGMVALNALPPQLSAYRERGVLRRLRTTPVGALRLVAAQLAVFLLIALCSTLLLLAIGRLAFGVGLPDRWALYLVELALTIAAMLALGVLIASLAPSSRVANACGALVFFPMMFFAGLWLPREAMGTVLRHISDFTPLGAGVGAMQDAARGAALAPSHLIVIVVYAVVCVGLAIQSFRWE
jgi:ABC-2 type transport system permease protein